MALLMLVLGFFLGWVMIPQPVWAESARDKIITGLKNFFSNFNTKE